MVADTNLSRRSVLVKGAQVGMAVSATLVAPKTVKAVDALAGKREAVPPTLSPSPAPGMTSRLI